MNDITPGKQFYARQIAALESYDLEAIMDQYHDDAVLVNFDKTVRGKQALREHFTGYLAMLGSLKVLSTDRWTETPEAIYFEATVRTAGGEAKVYDVFMLRDGRATYHFSGMISFTPLAAISPAGAAQKEAA
jgi:ketosteroid isomerase-like protein